MQEVVRASTQSRESGNQDWWRFLEAALAAFGSQAESILDCIEDEQDSGREKPVDIETLLVNVIPSVLQLAGNAKM